jgi:hypothetical protein
VRSVPLHLRGGARFQDRDDVLDVAFKVAPRHQVQMIESDRSCENLKLELLTRPGKTTGDGLAACVVKTRRRILQVFLGLATKGRVVRVVRVRPFSRDLGRASAETVEFPCVNEV